MTKVKPEKIDILEMELEQKLPYWLSPVEALKGKHDAERKRRAQQHAAEQNAKRKKSKPSK